MLVNIIKLFDCCERRKSSSCSAEQAAKAANGTLNIVKALDILSQNIGLFLEPKEVLRLTETSAHFEEQSKFNGAIKIRPNAPEESIINLINRNKSNLESLDLSKCKITENILTAISNCQNLKTLNLSNTNVDDKDLNKLANSESLKNSLHTLDLRGCQRVTDVSALAGCTSLHTLNLSNTNVDDEALNKLANSESHLESLDLSECKITKNILTAISNCQNLKTLILRSCQSVTDVSALAGCASLHTLNLSNTNVDDDDLNELANSESLKNSLHTLNLSGCSGVTNVSTLAGCTSLHTLNLSNTNIDDEALKELAKLPNLHTLNLSGCSGVTNVSTLAGCASLHTLDLTGCYSVTDVSALAGCANLWM